MSSPNLSGRGKGLLYIRKFDTPICIDCGRKIYTWCRRGQLRCKKCNNKWHNSKVK